LVFALVDAWLVSIGRLSPGSFILFLMNTYYLRIENAEGYVLIAMYLFICMRVTRITQKVLNQIT